MRLFSGLTMRVRIMALVLAVVAVAYGVSGVTLVAATLQAVEQELGDRVMSVARTVAQVDALRTHIAQPGGASVIQPLVERMRLATGVAYIVTLDMNRIRYSHPLQERIGSKFVGGDEGPAFAERSYVSRARGEAGLAVRAFAPILAPDAPQQVGVVVVGALVPGPLRLLNRYRTDLLLFLVPGLAIGLWGAYLLARQIKREMLDLEPADLARLLQEREAMVSAIGDGIIAIDRRGRLTVINAAARRILGAEANVGAPIDQVIPNTRLPEVMESGIPEVDQPMAVGRTVVLTKRVPIRVRDKVVGAVASFRDRTEAHRLSEELTGVARLAEAQRAQNHEWMNKLHTVAGLIELGQSASALEMIAAATEQQQEESIFVGLRFADHRVAGLLVGKRVRARELGVELHLHRQSRLEHLPHNLSGDDLVIVIGNLLENAMDAVKGHPHGQRNVHIRVRETAHSILILVGDNGHGIPEAARDVIWQSGFSTKGPGRGIGLALIRQLVEVAGGTVRVRSRPGRTFFCIRLPYLRTEGLYDSN